jgi:hypothetical protein
MTAFTNHAETLVLTWLFTASAATRPTAWYVALHTADPTEVGNVGELSGNGYARQSATFAIAGNEASNSGTLTFGPNTGTNWGSVSHLSIWDAVTTGNCIAYGALSSAVTISVGDSLTIAAGALDVTLN